MMQPPNSDKIKAHKNMIYIYEGYIQVMCPGRHCLQCTRCMSKVCNSSNLSLKICPSTCSTPISARLCNCIFKVWQKGKIELFSDAMMHELAAFASAVASRALSEKNPDNSADSRAAPARTSPGCKNNLYVGWCRLWKLQGLSHSLLGLW